MTAQGNATDAGPGLRASLLARLDEEAAIKWRLWVDHASEVLEAAGVTDYEDMGTDADVLIDRVKDYAFDLGYRAMLHDLTPRIGDVLEAFARDHLGPPLADPLAATPASTTQGAKTDG